MAKVITNVYEKILNISNWHGVNEAPEGEARLRLGEAAVMRNFCVTSGGALKKRPGSRNVAGLLSDYVLKPTGSERRIYEDVGLTAHKLWARADVDELGVAAVTGEPVEVDGEEAMSRAGYYIMDGGDLWQFTRCTVKQGEGTDPIGGGMATRRPLAVYTGGRASTVEPAATTVGEDNFIFENKNSSIEPAAVNDGEDNFIYKINNKNSPIDTSTGSNSGIYEINNEKSPIDTTAGDDSKNSDIYEINNGISPIDSTTGTTSENSGIYEINNKISPIDTTTGTTSIQVWPGARMEKDVVSLTGQPVTYGRPTGKTVGFETKNVGGFFLSGGRLWLYYGAKMEKVEMSRDWQKYSLTSRQVTKYSYSRTGFVETDRFTVNDYNSVYIHGYSSYSYDEATGTFSGVGSMKALGPGDSGTVYMPAAGMLHMYTFTRNSPTESLVVEQRDTVLESSTTQTEYSLGSSLGTVTVRDGDRPEQDMYSYVSEMVLNGESYTVMSKGRIYYAYKRVPDGAVYGSYTYNWYGYPLTPAPNTYEWQFRRVITEANTAEDRQIRGIWSGYVGGREVLCACCGGYLWELKLDDGGTWSKVPAGSMDTSSDVHMFGFDGRLWLLNGKDYKVWDGARLEDVEGYRPLVSVAVEPGGGGTLLESVNRLSAGRRAWFSPDGTADTFTLPERDIASVDWVRNLADGSSLEGWSADLEAGTVKFSAAPGKGVDSIEIAWTSRESQREQVCGMRFAELYNGAQDSRVFIYGDGSNKALYSGLDYDGRPRADYFPDLCEVAVGEANTPITAMIRHYNKLMAFKTDSAWSIGYDTITLVDGTVTAGFYVAPVNRSIGCCAYGQAQLVQNRPRTLDGRSVIEWKATSSSGITGDQRNAERVSQRVDSSIRRFDLTRARTFYDKFSHEYYVIGEDGTAIAQNLDVDAWYVYTGLDVTCMINYRDELYYGTRDGFLRHFSDRYFSDNGEAIDAVWESGAMSFSEDFRRKYSAMVWIGIKPEDNGYLEVTAETDRKSDFAVYDMGTDDAAGVPEMERLKIKAKKFTYYKLILRNNTADKTVTVVSADMRVRGTGYVR